MIQTILETTKTILTLPFSIAKQIIDFIVNGFSSLIGKNKEVDVLEIVPQGLGVGGQ